MADNPTDPGERFTHQLGVQCRELKRWAKEIGLDLQGIRIIASSTNEEDITHTHSHGAGNYHAQRGAVREWMKAKDAYDSSRAAAEGQKDFWDGEDDAAQIDLEAPPQPPPQPPPTDHDDANWWKEDP